MALACAQLGTSWVHCYLTRTLCLCLWQTAASFSICIFRDCPTPQETPGPHGAPGGHTKKYLQKQHHIFTEHLLYASYTVHMQCCVQPLQQRPYQGPLEPSVHSSPVIPPCSTAWSLTLQQRRMPGLFRPQNHHRSSKFSQVPALHPYAAILESPL